jgi:hypothetical protein
MSKPDCCAAPSIDQDLMIFRVNEGTGAEAVRRWIRRARIEQSDPEDILPGGFTLNHATSLTDRFWRKAVVRRYSYPALVDVAWCARIEPFSAAAWE